MLPPFLIATAVCCFVFAKASTTTTTEVQLDGLYKWVLVCDIDNSGGGEYVRQQTIVTTKRFAKTTTVDELKRKLSGSKSESRSKIDMSGMFKTLSVTSSSEQGYSSHEELLNQIAISESNSYADDITKTLQETITVRSGEKFSLYQLQFTAPGIFQTFPITATNPKEVKVLLTFRVEVSSKKLIVCDGCTFALKTHHGNFLGAKKGGEKFDPHPKKVGGNGFLSGLPLPAEEAVHLVNHIQAWEKWTFVQLYDDVYGIRSRHGTYLSARAGGENGRVDLQADKRDWDDMPFEKWTVVQAQDGRVALRSIFDTYVRAHENRLDQTQDKAGWDWNKQTWEQFKLIPVKVKNGEL